MQQENNSDCPRQAAPTLTQMVLTDSSTVGELLWMYSCLCQTNDGASISTQNRGASWLFALLTVTEKPPDSDTSAALRSIVRQLVS